MTLHVFDFTHIKCRHLPFNLSSEFTVLNINTGSVENLSFFLPAVYVANSGEQVVEELMLNTAM